MDYHSTFTKKIKYMPELSRRDCAKALIDLYAGAKTPFILTCSNYTAQVELIHTKRKFVRSLQSPQTFAAFAKIKKDVKDKPVPVIDRDQIRYFQHDFRKDGFFKLTYNIDLKSAYATILFNDGIISAETFSYMKRLKKPERLACVGMLASKKHSVPFENGEPGESSLWENPLANFFYYAVMRTDEIMSDLKQIVGRSYMFTWVDGIYFSDKKKISACADYLKDLKMFYTEEILENFNVRVLENKVTVLFKKDGKIKGFNLPNRDTEFQNLFLKALQAGYAEEKRNHKTKKTK